MPPPLIAVRRLGALEGPIGPKEVRDLAVTKTSRNAFHSLRNERIAAGDFSPTERLLLFVFAQRWAETHGKVFIIVSDRKAPPPLATC